MVIFLFLCLVAAPFINAAMDIEENTIDDDAGSSQPSGEAMNETSASTNSSNNNVTDAIYVVHVAIYNVSELENDPNSGLNGEWIDKNGSENWKYTGTYGMKAAMESMDVWEYNGKKYKFIPEIIEFNDIVNRKVLSTGKYKLFLAPGDDDYFTDQKLLENGKELVSEIRKFVENGGGYLGTCGGAEFACKMVYAADTGELIYGNNSNVIPHPLGIIDATAWTSMSRYKSNRAYFYRGIMFDSGTPEQGNGSGVSDWGGIPLKNNFNTSEPIPPFNKYWKNSLTLRYWGGPWFEPGRNAIGVAWYDEKACEDKTILLHYKKLNGAAEAINLSKYIGGQWSILEQDRVNGEGRIVIFGCHPEHKTWEWGSGKIMENENYDEYIYANPKNASSWQEIKGPNVATYDIIQEAAKWIVEPMLDNITETLAEYENSSDMDIHFAFPDAPMDGDNYIPYTPSNPSPANNSTNVSKNITLSWHSGDFGGDAVKYYLTIKEMNSTNSTTICIDGPVIYIFLPPVSPFLEHILYHLDPEYANQDKLILRYQPDGERTPAADYVQCKLYNLQSNTKYEWKVVAVDEKNATASSQLWTFETGG